MLDNLLEGIKGQLATTIAEKAGLSLGQAEAAVPVAKDSIIEGVMGAVSGGNVGGVLDMLKSATSGNSGGLVENMVYKSIAGNFINNITSKLGLSEGIASTVSSLALPMIMEKIGGAAKAAGDTNEIDKSSVMNALGLDTGSLLNKAAGSILGDKAGGIAGALGGLFKKK
jgi:uncharacterized protein YidB (DUF937 family)